MDLAVNAQDAMPKGGRPAIETTPVDPDSEYAARHEAVHPCRYVMPAVSDIGHGMNLKTLERILDRFFATKEKGQGSTFKFYFPAAIENRPDHETYAEPPG